MKLILAVLQAIWVLIKLLVYLLWMEVLNIGELDETYKERK